ncbi:MAG: autotransporter-associated beta strand repeat-containing protein, partial [Betaproteobacteria bacterium]|nr:autotransporter-associated beta strand repeat-containing protein [Betaproteobacteria bacterium]
MAVSLISAMLLPATASATCTTTGNNTTCSGSTTLGGSSIGNGPSGPDNATVTVTTGATVTSGPGTVISLRDYAIINIEDNATVTGHAGVGGSGLYVAGKNTIEFRSYGVLTIGQGATVNAAGTSTDSNAIDMIGQGNTINNYGTISSTNAVAIWFEDQVVGAANVINNYGTIQSGNGSSQSVIGNTVGSGGSSDVYFTNYTGAVVYGSLLFGGGNDVLTLYPSSVVTGSFDGGGGTNTLTLAGTVGSSDTLSGSINNFQFLTKIGQGTWTLTGTVGNSSGGPLAVEVQQGTLVLTGNNTSFNGSVLVDSAGILQARAQSLPPSITDNGLVNFAQPDDGTYAGIISGSGAVSKTGGGILTLSGNNTYQGGTLIQGGTVAVSADNQLGDPSGSITLDGGTLELTSSFNLSSSRAMTVTANNGTIQTDSGVTSTVSQAISGAGALTAAGSGSLILANTNTYSGGTTISGGTLQIGAGGTTGSIVGDVVNNGALVFNRSDISTFSGLISGTGTVNQAGAGVTILSANNTYAGPTTISSGWLYIDGDQSGAGGAVTANPGTRLGGNGIIGGDVTIADNATLSPGSHPRDANTITINGDLTLSNNAILLSNLFQANVAGGALNDLTIVNGDLYLGGVINVVDLGNGQVLGPGVYRLIDYSGTLYASDGSAYNSATGLQVGNYVTAPANPQETSTPTGPLTGFCVQTAIPGQINLVNS